MKKNLLISLLIVLSFCLFAQVTVENGPALDNDRDSRMNRMLNGDENSYYCYRIRSKGKGTSFYVEKYDKQTLKPVFSKEISSVESEDTKIEHVMYSQDIVYVFRSQYNKDAKKMSLYYQTVSSTGQVSSELTEIVGINTDHAGFVDFEIFMNSSKTKFLVKAANKASKDAEYKTDFIAFSIPDIDQLWKKTVNVKLRVYGTEFGRAMLSMLTGINFDIEDAGYIGLYYDDNDNIYYGYTVKTPESSEKEKRFRLNLGILDAKSDSPVDIELRFEEDYWVKDIEFSKTNNNEIVVGGFFKDVIERTGRDLVQCGIFSFTINLASHSITSKITKKFDDQFLQALESNKNRSRYFRYKLDYILPVGDAIFYIGEQYQEQMIVTRTQYTTTTTWHYEYMDVIVAKVNSDGEFEWIKNAPLRNKLTLNLPHVFKQYIAVATKDNIYIIYNDHPKNMAIYEKPDYEPRDLKAVSGIHGSNFVFSAVSVIDGKIKRGVIFNNKTYCFAPIQEKNPQFFPPSETENFVSGAENKIYIYTEDKGKDRFAKLLLQ